jgi:hypothetical protein
MSGLSYEESMLALGGRLPGRFSGVTYGRGMGDAQAGAYGKAREEWKVTIAASDRYVSDIQRSIKSLRDKRDAYQNAAINMERDLGPLGYQIKTIAGQIVGLSIQIGDMIDQIEPEFNRINGMYQSFRSMTGDAGWLAAERVKPSGAPGQGAWVAGALAPIAAQAASANVVLRDLDANYQALQNQAQVIKESKEKEARELKQIADDQARAQQQLAQQASDQAASQAAAAAAANQAAIAQADAAARVELARIQAAQAAQAAVQSASQGDRALQLEMERQRMAADQALQAQLFALEQARMEREYAREEKTFERQEERDQLAMILQLMDKGLIQPGQVELEGIGPLGAAPGAQQQGYGYGAPYQGGAVPPGYHVIDDTTGQPVQQAYPGAQPYTGFPQAYGAPQGYPAPQGYGPPPQGYGYPGTPSYGPPPVVAPQFAPRQQQAPQQQAPQQPYSGIPGIEYSSSFTPGAELFGMGGLGASAVSLPPGSTVAPGYGMAQDPSGNWVVTAPDGRTFTMSAAQVGQAGARVGDPKTGTVFYTTPSEASFADSFGNLLSTITPFGLTAGEAYLKAKRGESILPPQQLPQGGGGGISGGMLALGGLAAAGVVAAVVISNKKPKKKG